MLQLNLCFIFFTDLQYLQLYWYLKPLWWWDLNARNSATNPHPLMKLITVVFGQDSQHRHTLQGWLLQRKK